MHLPRVIWAVFVGSLAASVAARLLNAQHLALWLGGPALLLSAWAVLGHLITIDDDAPGGWSNQDGSQAYWHGSLRELAVKFGVLTAAIIVVAWTSFSGAAR